jgi:hypothetical protein
LVRERSPVQSWSSAPEIEAVEMHHTWVILRLMSTVVGVAYCVLYVVTARRLGGRDRRFVDTLLPVVVAFVAIRILAQFILLNVLIYRFALVIGGVAALIGVSVQMKALMKQEAINVKPNDGNEART